MTRAFPRTFKLALLDKDVRIAADFAREHGAGTPLLQLCAELLRIARHELGEEADHVEATKVIEAWAGVRIAEAYGNAGTIHG
jgi:3-hydroxyisobutyrate dehydrogenase